MAKRGQSFVNPVTGTRLRLLGLPEDNGGRELVIEWTIPTGEALSSRMHFHAGPSGETLERFDVVAGTATCRIGSMTRTATATGSLLITANTLHAHPVNSGEGPLVLKHTIAWPDADVARLRRIQRFFETEMALAQKGMVSRDGTFADLLQSLVTYNDTLIDPIFLPTMPRGVQKALFAIGAKVARWLGYEATARPLPSAPQAEPIASS